MHFAVAQTPDTLRARQLIKEAHGLVIGPGDFQTAIPLLQEATAILEAAESWPLLIEANCMLAQDLTSMSRLDEAQKVLERNLPLALKHLGEDHANVAQCYNNLGYILGVKGDYQSQQDYHARSLAIRKRVLGENHPKVAQTMSLMGYFHGRRGDYDRQLEMTFQALEIREQSEEVDLEIAVMLNNIGFCYARKGDYVKSREYYEQGLEFSRKHVGPQHPSTANAYNNLGAAYGRTGDYVQQLIYFQQAFDIWLKWNGPDDVYVARSYTNIATCQHKLGEDSLALIALYKAQRIYEKHADTKLSLLAETYQDIGTLLGEMGRLNEGKIYLQGALALYKEKYSGPHPFVATSLSNIGKHAADMGELETSLDYLDRALSMRIEVSGEKHPETARIHLLKSKTFERKGELAAALLATGKAIAALSDSTIDPGSGSLPPLTGLSDPLLMLKALYAKAQLLELRSADSKDLVASHAHYVHCTKLVEMARREIGTESAQIGLTARHLAAFEGGIRTAAALHELKADTIYLETAFSLMEKSKYLVLLSALNAASARKYAGIPDSLLERERVLKIDLRHFERSLSEARKSDDSARIQLFRSYYLERKAALDSLQASFKQDYPSYYALQYAKQSPTVAGLRKSLLQSDKAFVEYFVGDSAIYALMITRDELKLHVNHLPGQVLQAVRDLRLSIVDSDFIREPKRSMQAFRENASFLYTHLSPFLTELEEEIEQVIIVPDADLNALPFEVLLMPETEMNDPGYAQLPYLIRRFGINYGFSAAILSAEMNKEPADELEECMALAPAYPGIRPQGQFAMRLREVKGMEQANLPGAELEVKAIAEHLDGDVYIGDSATEKRFKRKAGDYQVLHLAMHAFADPQDPMNSNLSFATVEDSSEDGKLHAYEVYGLELNAELLVLSACETGSGKLMPGEGTMSLARAFHYAGCSSVLMSLWPVDDRATTMIMDGFYQALSKGRNKAEALRFAKLNYLENCDLLEAHPFYWAGFVLVGDHAPLSGGSIDWLLWGLLIAVAAAWGMQEFL